MSNSLEPKNGDFVAYLKELEAGRLKDLKGLSIQSASESDSGMLTVTKLEEEKPLRRLAPFTADRGLPAAFLTTAGSALLLLGGGVFALALSLPNMLDAMPVAMFLVFFGIVATAEGRKRRKKELHRQQQQRQTDLL